MKKLILTMFAAMLLCGTFTGCKSHETKPVNGTIDQKCDLTPPEAVINAMKQITPADERLETVMEDKASGVAVYSLLKCSDDVSSEGYGMLIAHGDVLTALPNLRHGNMPRARFDASTGDLWVIGSDTEGTGVLTERAYRLRFGEDGHAEIAGTIDPFEIQLAIGDVLTYSINGQDITFYSNGKELVTAVNQIKDMGEFMDDAIYVGEQIAYSIDGPLTVHVTPGLNFVTGKVLHYDDMPTFSAPVTMNDDGKTISMGELTLDIE